MIVNHLLGRPAHNHPVLLRVQIIPQRNVVTSDKPEHLLGSQSRRRACLHHRLQSYNHTYNSRPYSPSRDVAETDSRLPQIHVYSHNLGLFRNDYDARNLSPIVPEWPALISIATQILLTQLQNQRISKVGATVQLVK